MNLSATDHLNSIQGAKVHYARWGHTGPRLLLLHPIGFEHSTWDRVVPQFQKEYQIAAPDFPGHGRSEKPGAVDYGVEALGRRMVTLLDELEWEDAIVVGNSLGGGAALAMALQAPERVRGLALVNSVAYRGGLPAVGRLAFLPIAPLASCYAPAPLQRIALDFARHGWGNARQDRCNQAKGYLRDPEGRAAFFRTLRQLYGPDLDRMAPHYPRISCPTVVLHGVADPLIGLRHAERLAREIPAAKLIPLARCGHFPQEERPADVCAVLREFFGSLSTANCGQSLACPAP